MVERRVVGEKHLKLMLRSTQSGRTIEAIAFRAVGTPAANEPRVRAAYRLDVNEYQGRRSVQLVVEHLERVE